MSQLTLRGFDPQLEKSLRELAARDNSSLNKAALKLMRRGAGLDAVASSGPGIGDQLRQFSGGLSKDEADAIDQAISESRQSDVDLQS
jgi:CHASE3 domain sensor protein